MVPVLEIVVAIGLIVLAYRVVPRLLEQRARRLHEKDARRARLEAARSAEDMVKVVMVDRVLAREVYEKLGSALAKEMDERS